METINQVVNAEQRYITRSQIPHGQTASATEEFNERLINRFFAKLKVIYGAARYSSVFPDQYAEASAKREWGKDILQYSLEELLEKILYAKAMSHQKEWRWLDIGLILAGDKPIGAAGQAAMSYRPAAEVMGLPPPPRKQAATARGQKKIADIKAGLD